MNQEEREMLQDSARSFISECSPLASLRAIRDGADMRGYHPEFWRQACALGWSGITAPVASGGSELGVTGAGIVAREMGRRLVLSSFISSSVMSVMALSGVEGVAEDRLARIATGDASVAVAVEHISIQQGQRLKARRGKDGYNLTGTLAAVPDGHIADALFVAATADDEGQEPLLFLVEGIPEGLIRQVRKLVDGRRVCDLHLEGIPAGAPLSLKSGQAPRELVERVLDAGRICVAARLCGTAEAAFERTLDYLKERQQFGRPIGSFQALQHRAAHLHCQIEDAWSATLKAMRAFDDEATDRAFTTAVAKAKASDVACRVTAECLQLHGGIGMTDECDIGLYLKYAHVDAEWLGSVTFHTDRVARHLGY
ncbi:hypothetical protein BB934_36810 (plasmid) [Microvirga ossetica]|uniref:Acyl-CoA dehydrogenase n=1 Tax=Microvirga ossetica TaxID=1882682 RepID=A0A1B2EV12_9HYPH|nr:acyl-CoA dehydrogenase family protein [Microvirga ossetica]ANY83790.1 hypothetical protein BB934_36810 [Microvirga ossetica]